jgi:RNA ligase
MSEAPRPYPRVPHLVGGRGSRDDLVLTDDQVASLLGGEVLVEEKVDGANVALWLDGGQMQCSLRAGIGAMDRAGQLGPLRAWVASHDEGLRAVLGPATAMYAEWMLLSHTVTYDRLPSFLVVLDLWERDSGFIAVQDRNKTCATAGLVTPPEVWRGIPLNADRVEQLFGPSAWSSAQMEGLVVRRLIEGGEPRLAKLVRGGFDRLDDAAWRQGRPRNRLAEGASWR